MAPQLWSSEVVPSWKHSICESSRSRTDVKRVESIRNIFASICINLPELVMWEAFDRKPPVRFGSFRFCEIGMSAVRFVKWIGSVRFYVVTVRFGSVRCANRFDPVRVQSFLLLRGKPWWKRCQKRFSGCENHFQGLLCFETKAMVEMVPKTILRVRKSFSRAFLFRSQSHGRKGTKNDFQGAKIIFKGFFVSEPKPW